MLYMVTIGGREENLCYGARPAYAQERTCMHGDMNSASHGTQHYGVAELLSLLVRSTRGPSETEQQTRKKARDCRLYCVHIRGL